MDRSNSGDEEGTDWEFNGTSACAESVVCFDKMTESECVNQTRASWMTTMTIRQSLTFHHIPRVQSSRVGELCTIDSANTSILTLTFTHIPSSSLFFPFSIVFSSTLSLSVFFRSTRTDSHLVQWQRAIANGRWHCNGTSCDRKSVRNSANHTWRIQQYVPMSSDEYENGAAGWTGRSIRYAL